MTQFDIEIPLFAMRRGYAAGLNSALFNLIIGLARLGRTVSLPYTREDRLESNLVAWIRRGGKASLRRCPAVPGGMSSRFAEETIYAQLPHRGRAVLYPNYFLPPGAGRQGEEVSVIVHDCQHRSLPEYFSRSKRAWLDWNFARTLRKADHVFLISEFEKSQIARFFGENLAERGKVIYNPVDWDRYDRGEVSERAVQLSAEPYILTVAHQYPHKNTVKAVRAFLRLAEKRVDIKLVLVGRESDEAKHYVAALNPALRSRVHFLGFVSDADLGHFYRHAALFVLASSYEGFGLPAVEAMGFGIPVLVTRGSSLPEVTMENANYCDDSASEEEWAEAMAAILEAPKPAGECEELARKIRSRYKSTAVAATMLMEMGQISPGGEGRGSPSHGSTLISGMTAPREQSGHGAND